MSGPWFKFYPASWVSGVRGLTLTQKGLFIELISLMYDRDGPLTDSDEELAKQIGARLSTFQAALDRLIERDLITRDERGLMSRRAAKEINLRAKKCASAANSAAKRWGKDEKKQQPSDADAMQTQCEGNAKAMLLEDRRQKIEEKKKPSVSSKRGTRLPEDWKPSERNIADASGMGMSSQAISTEADKFRDYWIAKPGAGGVKLDWDATWRNWCRNASSRQAGKRQHGPSVQSLQELFADELGDADGRGSNVVAFGGAGMTDNAKFQRAMPFIEHMEAHYKRHEFPKVFYADLADAIGQFSTPVLQEAAKRIIRQRVYAKWPSVAECLDAVQAVSQEAREAKRTYANEVPDGYRVTDDQAKRMLLCEEGYAAALEGYHLEVFYHIRKTGDFPDARALREIVAKHRAPTFVDHKGKEWSRKEFWEPSPGEYRGIKVVRNAVLARRKQLKEYILDNYQSAASAG